MTNHDPVFGAPEKPNPFRPGVEPLGQTGVGAPGAPAPERPEKPAHPALWLVYLYLMPRKFYRNFVYEHTQLLTVVAAWLYGMSGAIDRLERQHVQGRITGAADTWLVHWGIVLGAGAIGGLLYYHIGGWWYRVRLGWSGVRDPDRPLSVRVYLYSAVVVALPTLIFELLGTGSHATPSAASASAGSAWHLLLLVFPFWSVIVSYIGVRTVFGARGIAGAVWFLLLPCLVYGGAIALMMGVALMGLWPTPAPQVINPLTHSSPAWSFSYPRNWRVMTEDPDYNADAYVSIDPPQDASLMMALYPPRLSVSLDADLRDSLETFFADGMTQVSRRDLATWGTLPGKGADVLLRGNGIDGMRLRVFVAQPHRGVRLLVHEVFMRDEESKLEPGFDLVRRSMRITPPP